MKTLCYYKEEYLYQIKKIIAIFYALALVFNLTYAQESTYSEFNLKEHQRKAPYRDNIRLEFSKEYSKGYPTYGISILNGIRKLWKIYSLDNGKQILEIESYKNGTYYREIYYSKNNNLIYAKDADRSIPNNSFEISLWECEFFFKNGKLYSEESLGHGKTERDDWNPNIIFGMYEKRKSELKILQNN